jgi:hypothetical protein
MADVVFGLLIAVPAVLVIASFLISTEKRRRGSTDNRRPPRG